MNHVLAHVENGEDQREVTATKVQDDADNDRYNSHSDVILSSDSIVTVVASRDIVNMTNNGHVKGYA